VRKFLYVDRDSSLVTSGPEPPEQADGGREVGKRTGVFSPRLCRYRFSGRYGGSAFHSWCHTVPVGEMEVCEQFMMLGKSGVAFSCRPVTWEEKGRCRAERTDTKKASLRW